MRGVCFYSAMERHLACMMNLGQRTHFGNFKYTLTLRLVVFNDHLYNILSIVVVQNTARCASLSIPTLRGQDKAVFLRHCNGLSSHCTLRKSADRNPERQWCWWQACCWLAAHHTFAFWLRISGNNNHLLDLYTTGRRQEVNFHQLQTWGLASHSSCHNFVHYR